MKSFLQVVGAIVSIVLLIALAIIIPWVALGNDLALRSFFLPRQEAVRREVFEQSKAYQEGIAQDVRAMQIEYIAASEEHKDAIASVILHRVADYEDQLPNDLRAFVSSLKARKGF